MPTNIDKKHAELGGDQGFLGAPLGEETATADEGGSYRDFEGGSIYDSESTGAHEIHGAIRAKFLELGWNESSQRLPNTDETIARDGVGRFNTFGSGHDRAIYWSPATGAHEMHGDIYRKWKSLGGIDGPLGYPTTDESVTPGDPQGRFNRFQGGAIYWSPATGAHELREKILEQWKAQGAESGALGFPTSDELPDLAANQRYNLFQNGKLSRNWRLREGRPPKAPGYRVKAWHKADLEFQESESAQLAAQGFKLISLSVYGDPDDPIYASVWILDPDGPEQSMAFKISDEKYQDYFDEQVGNGMRPILISATGSGSDTVFAAVFEKSDLPTISFHGLKSGPIPGPEDELIHDTSTFTFWCRWAKQNHYVLRWATVYGSKDHPRFAAIWELNKANVSWNVAFSREDGLLATNFSETGYSLYGGEEGQEVFDAQTEHWVRPSFFTRSPHGPFVQIYRDDRMDGVYQAPNLSDSEYQDLFDDKVADGGGWYPVCVQGLIVGGEIRIAAVLNTPYAPHRRSFVATGKSQLPLYALDEAMQEFLENDNVRSGSLAVAKDGKLAYARAFAWAEKDEPPISPGSIFRIGSNTKVVARILVYQLGENGLNLDDKYVDHVSLGDKALANLADKMDLVTIQQLLDHMAGLPHSVGGMHTVRDGLNELPPLDLPPATFPLSLQDCVDYSVTPDLDLDPGTEYQYSNTGFTMLSLLIEQKYGMSFEAAAKELVFEPIGVKRPLITADLLADVDPLEVRYHVRNATVGRSVMSQDEPFVPSEYGTRNFAATPGAGSLSMAAADYVRMLSVLHSGVDNALLKADTVTGASGLKSHYGGLPGAVAYMVQRNDGLSVAVSLNKDSTEPYDPALESLTFRLNHVLDALEPGAWPAEDLFPLVGIEV